MDKKEIQIAIGFHFIRINELLPEIISNHFREDYIGEFIIEVKKLKSFLKLLDMECADINFIKLPKNLKTFSGYLVMLRDLQLQLKAIRDYVVKHGIRTKLLYGGVLENGIEYWEKKARGFIAIHPHFFEEEAKLTSVLPDELRGMSIRKFIKHKEHQLLHLSTNVEEDEVLNTVNKILGEIFYNWELIEPHLIPLQVNFPSENEIRSLLEIFGDYNKKSSSCAFLEIHFNDSMKIEEKKVLQQMMESWQMEKQELKKVIFERLRFARLIDPDFRVLDLKKHILPGIK